MGLRMGLARDFKIVRTVERLNQIIHKSTLTSRFVSMFYGELEVNGVFIYVNAGHPPPFHSRPRARRVSSRRVARCSVLSPPPPTTAASSSSPPATMIVLYTDGMIEAAPDGPPGGEGAEYGVERLVALARSLAGRPAKEIVEAMLADVEAWCGDAAPNDDRTVVVVTSPLGTPA